MTNLTSVILDRSNCISIPEAFGLKSLDVRISKLRMAKWPALKGDCDIECFFCHIKRRLARYRLQEDLLEELSYQAKWTAAATSTELPRY